MNEISEQRGPGRPRKYHEAVEPQAVKLTKDPNFVPAHIKTEEPSRPARRARNPFGAATFKLAYPARENFHRHWFNDVGDRVQSAERGGYEHVKDEQGKNVCRVVGIAEGGGPLHAYLMEIPEEWFKADMTEQQQQVDAREAQMRRGTDNQLGEHGYVPAQGISIKRG